MFSPRYTITPRLLTSLKRATLMLAQLEGRRFPTAIHMSLEDDARVISTYASTSIEGNPLELTQVKQILKSQPQQINRSEKEVLNYNHALRSLYDELKSGKVTFNQNFILKLQRQISQGLVSRYQLGKLRSEPVFVNNPKTGETIYWPPDSKDVAMLLTDLFHFVSQQRQFLDNLILAGLFHKQFVIIHPFIDGNGRTARLATTALLASLGLDMFSLFSFENYYNNNVTAYFTHVGVFGNYYDIVGQIDFTAWLEYFAEGVVSELKRVKNKLEGLALTPEKELRPYHQSILKTIKEKGFITHRDYGRKTDRAKATRSLDFNKLIKLGLIKRQGRGRATYYILND